MIEPLIDWKRQHQVVHCNIETEVLPKIIRLHRKDEKLSLKHWKHTFCLLGFDVTYNIFDPYSETIYI